MSVTVPRTTVTIVPVVLEGGTCGLDTNLTVTVPQLVSSSAINASCASNNLRRLQSRGEKAFPDWQLRGEDEALRLVNVAMDSPQQHDNQRSAGGKQNVAEGNRSGISQHGHLTF